MARPHNLKGGRPRTRFVCRICSRVLNDLNARKKPSGNWEGLCRGCESAESSRRYQERKNPSRDT